jgi:hypothetical protein
MVIDWEYSHTCTLSQQPGVRTEGLMTSRVRMSWQSGSICPGAAQWLARPLMWSIAAA